MSRGDPDVIIVGGGLVGCLVARTLADDGVRVTVFEQGTELGRRASTAAAGMLSPQMEWAEELIPDSEVMLNLCVAARERWPEFARRLEAETGVLLHYRDDGTLVVALTEEQEADLQRRADAQRRRGLHAEWLDARAARSREPGLSRAAKGALFLPDDHQVDPLPLMAAAAKAIADRREIEIVTGRAVSAIESSGGRVTGVATNATADANGSMARFRAEHVVLAAGAWSAGIEGLPRSLAVRPVKGQMAALRPERIPIRHVVGGRGAYCVPRDDGRVVVGATVEDAGFDESVDPAAVDVLVAAATEAVPALGAAPVEARWAGLRPGTGDELPILGPDPDLAGLLYATGHYRNGILLAPLTAELVAADVLGSVPPVDAKPFSAARPALAETLRIQRRRN